MKKIFNIIACAMCAMMLALASCSQDEFITYDGSKSGIYFQRVASTDLSGTPLTYTDSIVVSFTQYKAEVTETNVKVPVNVMGNPVDRDRHFSVVVNKELSTAQEGVHFELDQTNCVIPAGEVSTTLPVKIKRTEDLLKSKVRLVLELQDNEEFTVELKSYKNTASWNETGKELCGSQFKVVFSDMITMTYWWDWFGYDYFGEWSVIKETLLNQLMGWTHYDWQYNTQTTVAYGRLGYAAKKFREYLQARADAGDPAREEDGSFMQLGSGYEIDYSAYEL